MAFRNAALNVTTANTLQTLYTCPASYEAVVHALYVANNNPLINTDVYADVRITTLLPTSKTVYIIRKTRIIYGTTLVFDKPINLRPGDIIEVSCDTANSAEVFASVLLTNADVTAPPL
jgi:hypothetical protein